MDASDIFDRYGKLVKNLFGNNSSWDGTSNGTQMIESDYWFLIDLDGVKTFKGHFALKR